MDNNDLILGGNVPFRLASLFVKPGRYELTVAVKSANDSSATYAFIVNWNGRWNEIKLSDLSTDLTRVAGSLC